MDNFWRLFEKSVITSSTIAVILVATLCYMAMTGHIVPDWLIVTSASVIGYFFGQKNINPQPATGV